MTRFEVEVVGATLVGDDHGVGDHWSPDIDHASSLVPLVLLHAGVNDRRSWLRVIPTWSTKRRVITYDRRGFGESSWQEVEHDPTGDLLAVLDERGISRAVLVGASNGGAIAIQAALDHPDRVDGLLLVAPSMTGMPWESVPEEDELEAAVERAVEAGDIAEANRLEARLWLDGIKAAGPRVDTQARTLFLEMNERALTAPPRGPVAERATAWDRLEGLVVPTLVVTGELDLPWFDQVVAPQIVERAAEATSATVQGAAHLPHLEAHLRFLSATRNFLDSLH